MQFNICIQGVLSPDKHPGNDEGRKRKKFPSIYDAKENKSFSQNKLAIDVVHIRVQVWKLAQLGISSITGFLLDWHATCTLFLSWLYHNSMEEINNNVIAAIDK